MEFACSVVTFEWLANGGMTHVNGEPVSIQVVDRMPGGHNVIVAVRSEQLNSYRPGEYAWQKAA
jgi:hypothetical protein